MSLDFSNLLDLEIEQWEKIVESLPEVRYLAQLRRLKSLRPGAPGLGRPRPPVMPPYSAPRSPILGLTGHPTLGMPAQTPGRKMAPDRLKALELAESLLVGQSEPIKTADILAHLRSVALNIGGSDPINSLSALLSTSRQFQAHGRSGWTLKSPDDIANERAKEDIADVKNIEPSE